MAGMWLELWILLGTVFFIKKNLFFSADMNKVNQQLLKQPLKYIKHDMPLLKTFSTSNK